MTDREALLAAALHDPADDTARLVLADFLRESDDPADRALGRFVWAGVTAASFRDEPVIDDPLYYTAQQEIAAVAAAGHPAAWLSALGLGPRPLSRGDWAWDSTLDRVTVRVGTATGLFTRGMLAGLTVTLAEWCAAAPKSLASWPLAGGTITDAPGLTLAVGPEGTRWRLTVRLKLPGRRVPMTAGGVVPAAVSPRPFLVEESTEYEIRSTPPDRASLVASLAATSLELVGELREEAGDRWPGPPRRG